MFKRSQASCLSAIVASLLLAQTVHASTIDGINHTHWAINRFSVDGRSAIDIIGPYQGGGGGVVTSLLNVGCRG